MGLFDFGKKKEAPAPASPPVQSAPIDLGKKTGAISLSKGSRVTIEKTPLITATCSWPSKTDYDLYALVLMKDGTQKYVSTFGSKADVIPTPEILGGAVRHLGDVTRNHGGDGMEVIEIKMDPQIAAVVPIAYSAQSNGGGSFKKYRVSLGLDNNAGAVVSIDSGNANDDNSVYTVAIGIIWNDDNGVRIEALEAYSKRGSENRPAFQNGQLVMDSGAKNLYK